MPETQPQPRPETPVSPILDAFARLLVEVAKKKAKREAEKERGSSE